MVYQLKKKYVYAFMVKVLNEQHQNDWLYWEWHMGLYSPIFQNVYNASFYLCSNKINGIVNLI